MTRSVTAIPLDDFRNLFKRMPGIDESSLEAVRQRDAVLTKPPGSLGRMEELAAWLAGWQGRSTPDVKRPLVAVFATNHGIADRGVSAFPQAVTRQMVENFAAGGAAINQLCRAFDIGLKVFELALDLPTPDIVTTDAFQESECAATIAYGMEAIDGGIDLLCLGEMGIANTTVAAAIYHALYGGEAADWVGRGTGERDPLEILRRVGGREIAAMCGAIVAARMERVPVIVDGFVTTAAASVVHAMDPTAVDHCLFAHCSAEAAHARVLERLGKEPLLDLGMRLGEGTGAALAAVMTRAAAELHNGMATFEQAGVSGKS